MYKFESGSFLILYSFLDVLYFLECTFDWQHLKLVILQSK